MDAPWAEELERQKLDALKELAYGASHEINNPLANIAARAQTLLKDELHPERRRALEAIHQQAMRAHEMISDLMLFARPPRIVCEEVDLNVLANQVAHRLAQTAAARDIELTLTPANDPVRIFADPEQLTVALLAVCTNAVEAVGQNGKVSMIVRSETVEGASWGVCEISDTGPGISPEIREHLFDPFFSGREAGRGLGFGLSKCWRIVTQHGGKITVSSQPVQGAMFTIYLPSHY